QEYVFFCPKVRQGNFLAVEIRHGKGWRLCSDFSYGEKNGRAYLALPVTFVIVWIHSYLPCCSCRVARRTTMVFLAISTLSTPVHCRLSRTFFLLLTQRIWHSWRRISPPLHDTLSLFPKPIQFPENH